LGGLIGLLGGIAGVIIGIILGYLVKELLGQFHNDQETSSYFENPGRADFYEGEPGLAAFCALGILVAAETTEAAQAAAILFPGDFSLIEYFCRFAWSCRNRLNPDLLAESLAARRRHLLDLPLLALELYSLASGEKSRTLAAGVCRILDPQFKIPEQKSGGDAPKAQDLKNSWKILGLPPDTALPAVKSRFRKLAIQFHPDSLHDLDEEHRETASQAFIAIKEAYRKVVQTLK
jgi:DnaJ like chaperone protein